MSDTPEILPMPRWLKKSTIGFFKRHEDSIMAPKVVYLSRDIVVKTLANTYEIFSRDMHYITIGARIILKDRVSEKIYREDEVFRAETDLTKQLELVNEYFDRRIAQAAQKMQLAGYDSDDVPHKTVGYKALCSTRWATEYLDLVKKADLYLVLNEYLWIVGELSDTAKEAVEAKQKNEREARTQLLVITRAASKHFNVLHRICRGVMDERNAARLKQSANDKAAHKAKKAARLDSQQQDMDGLSKAEPVEVKE